MTSTQLTSRRRMAAASPVALLRHSSSLIARILARGALGHAIGSPGVALEFRVLGPLEVLVNGTPARLGGPRQRALLALLLVHANEVVPVARLVDEVWGDDPPVTAGNVLQTYVSQLRKALGRDAIGTRGRGYVVAVPDGALDLRRFERHASAGAQARADGRSSDAAAEFRAALALWRGAALSDLAEEPCARTVAARLDGLRLLALERAIEADLACGRDAELIAELEALVAAHPLHERFRALQMLALYRSGRQADALEAFRAPARPWSPSSAWSPAPRCATCSARSSSRIPGCPRRARPWRRRSARRSPPIRAG